MLDHWCVFKYTKWLPVTSCFRRALSTFVSSIGWCWVTKVTVCNTCHCITQQLVSTRFYLTFQNDGRPVGRWLVAIKVGMGGRRRDGSWGGQISSILDSQLARGSRSWGICAELWLAVQQVDTNNSFTCVLRLQSAKSLSLLGLKIDLKFIQTLCQSFLIYSWGCTWTLSCAIMPPVVTNINLQIYHIQETTLSTPATSILYMVLGFHLDQLWRLNMAKRHLNLIYNKIYILWFFSWHYCIFSELFIF